MKGVKEHMAEDGKFDDTVVSEAASHYLKRD